MKLRSTTIAQHSHNTGAKHYDRTDDEFRVAAMHHIRNQDGSNSSSSSNRREELTDEVAAKRARIEKEDEDAKIKKAQEIVKKSTNKKVQLGTAKI